MAIEERAVDEVVPRMDTRWLEAHALHPIERPQMKLTPRGKGGPIRFKVIVDVRAGIELADLGAIRLDSSPTVSTSISDG